MARFRFEAVDDGGRTHRGVVAGAAVAAVEADLEARGLLPLRIRPAGGADVRIPAFGVRKDVLAATRSISALLSAGLPLARCLELAEGHAGPRVAGPLAAVRESVERGESFARALADDPRVFPPLYRGLVRAGERSGDLEGALRTLVAHLEREEETRGRILSASLYPLILMSFGGAMLLVVVLWVVPRFAELVTDAGAALPATAAVLVGVSAFIRARWAVIVLGVAAAAVAAATSWLSPTGRERWGRWVLRIPLAGGLRRDVLAGRFARMLATLLQGGAPALSALRDVEESAADPLLRAATADLALRVREGEGLGSAMRAGGFFPDLLVRLVAIGEESGRLAEFTLKAADILEDATERAVRRWVALIEPAVIVVFGAMIGLVALALMQAIYGVNAGAFS